MLVTCGAVPLINDLRRRRPLENRPERTKTCITSSKMCFETTYLLIMVGHLDVFVKISYFILTFTSKVGLRNVLGTISEFSVKYFFGVIFYIEKNILEKVAR